MGIFKRDSARPGRVLRDPIPVGTDYWILAVLLVDWVPPCEKRTT
ncbi:hypothetical protein [Leptospira fluminis]|nr:hypothetical protein [Leptospira fluminis]